MANTRKAVILEFCGVEGNDVYNPTAPFLDANTTYMAARVEPRDRGSNSKTMFFTEKQGIWYIDESAPTFDLEDPFITTIGDELVFGGVQVYRLDESIKWKTVFYRGKDIRTLEKFAQGPESMKDIRLVGLPNGQIGVFTRPMSGVWGKGKIGYKSIDSLASLDDCDLYDADLIQEFDDNTWGGANAVYVLGESLLGVLGHVANFSNEKTQKHYRSMVFIFDYNGKSTSPINVIAQRADFPSGPAKRSPELDDILFSGGLLLSDKYAKLFTGLSDAQVGMMAMDNPFRS